MCSRWRYASRRSYDACDSICRTFWAKHLFWLFDCFFACMSACLLAFSSMAVFRFSSFFVFYFSSFRYFFFLSLTRAFFSLVSFAHFLRRSADVFRFIFIFILCLVLVLLVFFFFFCSITSQQPEALCWGRASGAVFREDVLHQCTMQNLFFFLCIVYLALVLFSIFLPFLLRVYFLPWTLHSFLFYARIFVCDRLNVGNR